MAGEKDSKAKLAKPGDRIMLTGVGMGKTSPFQKGDVVTVTEVKKGYVYWKGGGGVYNLPDRFTILEDEAPAALTETGPHWYL